MYVHSAIQGLQLLAKFGLGLPLEISKIPYRVRVGGFMNKSRRAPFGVNSWSNPTMRFICDLSFSASSSTPRLARDFNIWRKSKHNPID